MDLRDVDLLSVINRPYRLYVLLQDPIRVCCCPVHSEREGST
jgi:hypothetical protein